MATDQWPSANFPEVPDEFVDQMWSSLLSKVENRSPGVVDAKSLELEMQDKEDTEYVFHVLHYITVILLTCL